MKDALTALNFPNPSEEDAITLLNLEEQLLREV